MNTKKPAIWLGGVIGLLFTLPLMAVQFVGFELAGLPYLPFDTFDFVSRNLPGAVITFGIDAMVEVIIGLGGGATLDETAKLAEQLMAQGIYLLIGAAIGAVMFAVFRRRDDATGTNTGVIAGLVVAMPFALIVATAPLAPTSGVLLAIVWVGLLYVAFGAALNWAYHRLTVSQADASSTPTTITTTGVDRRQFLVQAGGATAVITVVGAGLGALLRAGDPPATVPLNTADNIDAADNGQILTDGSGNPLPNADAEIMAVPGTRQEYTPVAEHYRIDILSGRLPDIPDDYTLPITGLVANEVRWTLDEIRDMPAESAFITMSCISNRVAGSLISTTKWTGVPMQYILDQIQPDEDAVALKITGADNFDEYIELDLIRNDDRIMLAYAFDDEPLPLRNGYPLRVHIPDRYGMKQPKWIQSIEVVDAWEPGYWVRRGWSRDAIVRATSVIDTVADQAAFDADGQTLIPIGGIAWAGERGISRVQVRVDDGEWQDAQLRETMSDRTWTIWRYEWPFSEGAHKFEVVCYDGAGEMQITDNNPVRPDGATGVHSVRRTLAEA